LGEWTWCHCCWVPLQGANLCFICSFYCQGHQFHPDTQENGNEFCLELLADVTVFPTLMTQKLVFAIWGLCWYNFLKECAKSEKLLRRSTVLLCICIYYHIYIYIYYIYICIACLIARFVLRSRLHFADFSCDSMSLDPLSQKVLLLPRNVVVSSHVEYHS